MAPDGGPRLTLLRVAELNLGFFGLQLSFGLVIANSSPIFRTLGSDASTLPLLWMAGPVTGLLVQPIVGVLSDRTCTRYGRRTPYIALGALLASACLVAMPLAQALWVAVVLLWLLDTANNMVLEPYRACIADRLPPARRPAGFLMQSAFTGLAQTSAHLLPWLLALPIDRQRTDANGVPIIVRIAFWAGAVITAVTILYSLVRVREPAARPPGTDAAAPPRRRLLAEIHSALREMPPAMRRLALPMLLQWYAMFAFWQYLVDAVALTRFGGASPGSEAYREAIHLTQQLGTLYNFVAFLAALALIALARRLPLRDLHAICLAASGLAMLLLPHASSLTALAILMIGIGIGWASLMGSNHALLARCLPPNRIGTYMGLFNLFIVVPMLFESATMPLLYPTVLAKNPGRVLALAGFLMILAACITILTRKTPENRSCDGIATDDTKYLSD